MANKESIPESLYGRPNVIKIEITNACSSRCQFCVYKDMHNKKVNMTKEVFDKLIRDYEEIGAGTIGFSPNVGEVLLNRNCIEFMKKINNNPNITGVWLYTNLTELSSYRKKEIDILLRKVDLLGCSVGPNREDYKECFGKDNFKKVLKALDCLIDYKKRIEKHNLKADDSEKILFPLVHVAGRSMKIDPDIDKKLLEKVQKLGTSIDWLKEYYDWSGRIKDFGQEQPLVKVDRTDQKVPVCKLALAGAVVFANGDVGNCLCADSDAELKIGSLKENSLKEIFLSDKRREFLDSFSNGNMKPICAKCGFYVPVDYEELKYWNLSINPLLIGSVYNINDGKLEKRKI